ncbi:ribosomal L28 family-domain-containing protein [Phialemonium atrogriseum]|uniref:Large ribosomal subunit protein bL28m n=1 Tax=Phialemonium atrogriseum TaxID=1093897 RepID=A0AAJ0FU68_9PEZI|nr:ribosomal L28 family-domain-containing protein [Phialemonium atrogriseum]KAK1772830.1 ribosomal L28 family-domain-containing protein [Phialemonium atrogriseum]
MPPSLPLLPQRLITTLRLPSSSTTTTLLRTTHHAFSTTPHRTYKQKTLDPPIPSPTGRAPAIPPYPLGPRQVYKQSNTGLYGPSRIRFGNRVSEKYTMKSRRKWRPNVQQKRLWSASLGAFVRTRVTSRALRTIDKAGGLDEYLLGSKAARVADLGPWGWRLRWRVMQTEAVRERFRAEREALGLPAREDEGGVLEEGLLDGFPAGMVAEGATAGELMEEVDRMIEREEEFSLEEGVEEEEGFMREEKPLREVDTKA